MSVRCCGACAVSEISAGVNVDVGLNFDISRVSFKLQFWLRGPEIESRMPPSPHLGDRVGMCVGLNSEFDRARKLTTRRSQDAAAVCSGFTRIGLRSTRQPRRSVLWPLVFSLVAARENAAAGWTHRALRCVGVDVGLFKFELVLPRLRPRLVCTLRTCRRPENRNTRRSHKTIP